MKTVIVFAMTIIFCINQHAFADSRKGKDFSPKMILTK